MKPLRVSDAEIIILALQDEIRRSEESRYDHRLHAVLLVAQGMSGHEVARLLGDSPRTVAYWVGRFEEEGLSRLVETQRPGRPSKLNEEQIDLISGALRQTPTDYGLAGNLWDGKTLSAFIQQQWSIDLGVRQCQRMFRRFDFRLRKPRPVIARADPEKQAEAKKNSNT